MKPTEKIIYPCLDKNGDETQVRLLINKDEATKFFTDRIWLIDAIRQQKSFSKHQVNALIVAAQNCRKMNDIPSMSVETETNILLDIAEEAKHLIASSTGEEIIKQQGVEKKKKKTSVS